MEKLWLLWKKLRYFEKNERTIMKNVKLRFTKKKHGRLPKTLKLKFIMEKTRVIYLNNLSF